MVSGEEDITLNAREGILLLQGSCKDSMDGETIEGPAMVRRSQYIFSPNTALIVLDNTMLLDAEKARQAAQIEHAGGVIAGAMGEEGQEMTSMTNGSEDSDSED